MKNNKNQIENEKLLSMKELSEICGFTISFVKKAKREYDLPFYRFGKRLIRFKLSEVKLWMEQRKAA